MILLLVGGAGGKRALLLTSGVSALFAACLGSVGSYIGYTRAADIVAAASVMPKEEDLAGAGTQMLFTLAAPLGVTTVLFILIGVTWAVRRKSFEESVAL